MDELKRGNTESIDKSLTKNYNFGNFLGLIFPSIFTFVFLAIYQIVDGMFISKYVGPYAIAAVNLYFPVISIALAFGTMIGTGSNAYIFNLIGKGEEKQANAVFNQVIEISIIISVIFAVIGLVFMNPIMNLLGATEGNIDYLRDYYFIMTLFAFAPLLQTVIGILVIGEGKTVMAGILIVVGGVLNIILDYVFMNVFHLGTLGAAIATVIGYLSSFAYALYYYSKRGSSRFKFGPEKIEIKKMLKLFYNGSSEMVATLAAGVTALMMNNIAFKLSGEVGVSAVSVFLYVQFVVMAVFMGIATAVEPLFSYYLGKNDSKKIQKTFKICNLWTAIFSLLLLILVAVFSKQITGFFFEGDTSVKEFLDISERSVLLSAPAAIFVGFNILASGLFTAFGNGTVSAVLSGVRTFVLLVICLIVMPKIWGTDGLWISWAAAEAIALIISVIVSFKYKNKYHFM